VGEEDAVRLAMKASQEEPPPQAPQRYASAVMPPGLLEVEAMRLAMEALSVVLPP
jgi:hypothetical protein